MYYVVHLIRVFLFFCFFCLFCPNEKGLLNFVSERIKLVYKINPVLCTAFKKHMLPFKLSNTTIYRPHTPELIGPYLNFNYCFIGRTLKNT